MIKSLPSSLLHFQPELRLHLALERPFSEEDSWENCWHFLLTKGSRPSLRYSGQLPLWWQQGTFPGILGPNQFFVVLCLCCPQRSTNCRAILERAKHKHQELLPNPQRKHHWQMSSLVFLCHCAPYSERNCFRCERRRQKFQYECEPCPSINRHSLQ